MLFSGSGTKMEKFSFILVFPPPVHRVNERENEILLQITEVGTIRRQQFSWDMVLSILAKDFQKRWQVRKFVNVNVKTCESFFTSAVWDVTSASASSREISYFNVFNNFITSAEREKIATWKILDDGKSRRILACVRSARSFWWKFKAKQEKTFSFPFRKKSCGKSRRIIFSNKFPSFCRRSLCFEPGTA